MNQQTSSIMLQQNDPYSAHKYIYEALRDGGFFIGRNNQNSLPIWYKQISKSTVYEDYVAWCKTRNKEPFSKVSFGKVISVLIISVENIRPCIEGIRQRCYNFPTLRQAQKDFSKASNIEPECIFENYPVDDIPLDLIQKYNKESTTT